MTYATDTAPVIDDLDDVDDTPETIEAFIQERPLLSVGVAALIGFLLAKTIL
ncbi:MAG: hypothetical protein ISS15_02670 [Alphaproteobacteria bacterium]|nr:hypothetical protein [Alphaproteobacteria bacterium]MBL6938479.1 hypothetical protein [Alphaproteobacteria bacterium]MBL7096538.1 hypothetical protein [Alphaproteobacteria bacterium]